MPTVTITAKVPEELAAAIRHRATAADRTLSGEIRRALRAHLLNDESPAGTQGPRDDFRPVESAEHVPAG